MTTKSSVSLTDEQYAFAKALVEAGRFSSVSAVLQQGVDLLRQRMESEELETEALKVLLDRRLRGPFLTGAELDARIGALITDKRRDPSLRD